MISRSTVVALAVFAFVATPLFAGPRRRAVGPVVRRIVVIDMSVVDATGNQRVIRGTITDPALARIISPDVNLDSAVGASRTIVNDTNNYQALQAMLQRILSAFNDATYISVFLYEKKDIVPFVSDTNANGLFVDILPGHMLWHEDGSATSNNTQGVTGIRVTMLTIPPEIYQTQVHIVVRDHNVTYEQFTTPSVPILMKLMNVNVASAILGGSAFVCADLPDPVVNSVDELIRNYRNKLTSDEQQQFSGDREGFLPFTINSADPNASVCDPNDPDQQYILFVTAKVAHQPGRFRVGVTLTVAGTAGQQYFIVGESRDSRILDLLYPNVDLFANIGGHIFRRAGPTFGDIDAELSLLRTSLTSADRAALFLLPESAIDKYIVTEPGSITELSTYIAVE